MSPSYCMVYVPGNICIYMPVSAHIMDILLLMPLTTELSEHCEKGVMIHISDLMMVD